MAAIVHESVELMKLELGKYRAKALAAACSVEAIGANVPPKTVSPVPDFFTLALTALSTLCHFLEERLTWNQTNCPVLYRWAIEFHHMIICMIGAANQGETIFLDSHDFGAGQEAFTLQLEDQMAEVELELTLIPNPIAQWICQLPIDHALRVQRLTEAVIYSFMKLSHAFPLWKVADRIYMAFVRVQHDVVWIQCSESSEPCTEGEDEITELFPTEYWGRRMVPEKMQ